jgi:hypothetical protein
MLISSYERQQKKPHRIYFEKHGTGVRVWLGDCELWARTSRHGPESKRTYLLQALMETVIHGQMENGSRRLKWDKSCLCGREYNTEREYIATIGNKLKQEPFCFRWWAEASPPHDLRIKQDFVWQPVVEIVTMDLTNKKP